MEQYQDISQFITCKCREAGIRIESVPKLCGISRSTLYRYMKGITHINPDMERSFCEILALSEEDQEQLHKLISLSVYDAQLIKSRQELDSLLFEEMDQAQGCVELIYFDKEKYYRTLDELLYAIGEQVHEDTRCVIRIFNCMQSEVLQPLAGFIRLLQERTAESSMEQMLAIDSKDYLENTRAFISIARLLSLSDYKHYTAYLQRSDGRSPGGLFANTILLELQHHAKGGGAPGERSCYWFSFFEDGLSSCVHIDDRFECAFLQENFNRLKEDYDVVLCDSRGINIFGREIVDLSRGRDSITIKPNNCYDMVPMAQYETLCSRCLDSDQGKELDELLSFGDGQSGLQQQIDFLRQRLEYTYQHRHLNLMSKAGIVELARTGRLTDHLSLLPSFTKEETRAILEFLRDRNLDPEDPCRLYVTEKPLLKNGLIIVVIQGGGILVEYNQTDYQGGAVNNILFFSPQLEEVFFDYVEHHVPVEHALSDEETTAFLNMVIEKYL